MAIDGSNINIPFDKKDTLTFHGGKPHKDGTLAIGYNQFHLNGLYDCLNNRFIDTIIQGSSEANEHEAMIEMCERYDGEPAIFIADRGYESMNLFEHLNKIENYKYLIRVKDIESAYLSLFLLYFIVWDFQLSDNPSSVFPVTVFPDTVFANLNFN